MFLLSAARSRYQNHLQQSPWHRLSHSQCKTPYLEQTTTDKISKWVLSLALLILVWNPFFELSLPRLIDVMIWCTRITAKSCQTLLFVRPKPTTRPSITEYKDNKLMAINSCLEMLKNEWPLFTVYDIRTVRPLLFFSFFTFDSILGELGRY